MRRFFALSAKDQLRAYEQIHDFLGAGAPRQTDADREIERRRESLAALQQVADHLGLNGKAPTAQQFDRVAHELGLDWTVRRIGGVWGRWRFACEALRGEQPRLTAAQLSFRQRFSGIRRSREDYQTALRLWLSTDPPLTRKDDYNAWGREYNEVLEDGEQPVPMADAMRNALGISWLDVVRVGRGEIDAEEAARRPSSPLKDWTSGPHDLISLATMAQILGISQTQVTHLSRQPRFPEPVAVFVFAARRRVRAWLREDIETFHRSGQKPRRRKKSVRDQYYSAVELAPLIGVERHGALPGSGAAAPPPTGRVGGLLYWLKRDADRWIRANRDLIERRLARGPIKRSRSGVLQGLPERRPDKNGRRRAKSAKSSR